MFKDSTHFYLLMSMRGVPWQGKWQLKRVDSYNHSKKDVHIALRKHVTVEYQTKVLWSADDKTGKYSWWCLSTHLCYFLGGWQNGTAYKIKMLHRPELRLIRIKMWRGEKRIFDTGNIIDSGDFDNLRGGRIGVYSDSQEQVTWSALSYR